MYETLGKKSLKILIWITLIVQYLLDLQELPEFLNFLELLELNNYSDLPYSSGTSRIPELP
jgi:hypothetical protein